MTFPPEILSTIREIIEVIARTAVIYCFVLGGLRITGKREVGQMTPFDLTLLLLLSNGVQNAMVGNNNSVTGGIAAAGTLLILNRLITAAAARNRRFERVIKGTPTLLISRGHIIKENLKRESLSIDEIHCAMREHGISTIENVRLAVLEIDGSISFIEKRDVSATKKIGIE
jgi:uncharacterized membrane protein YcaP (DUF421 family)